MRSLRLGSRSSALARMQAWQVGDALQRLDPQLTIDYRFIESSGDRSNEPNAALVTARGGFTEDLGNLLDDGAIDLAVHSWKDLPLVERDKTDVAATLTRADPRDVLLIRRASLNSATEIGLKILSSSARRRQHLEDFLAWALPLRLPRVEFAPVRGPIEVRLQKLLRGDGDALVIAKAALDRLLALDGAALDATAADSVQRYREAQAVVRQALSSCRAMVLPLHDCPAAPAQGALAIEVPRATQFSQLWRAVNDDDTFDVVTAERSIAARCGDDEPLGLTRLRFDFGDIEFFRRGSTHAHEQRVRLCRFGAGLPKPRDRRHIWDGGSDVDRSRLRLLLPGAPRSFGDTDALLVARDEALPPGAHIGDATVIWTAGLTTWRKLAARGYWVVGSDESLGETAALGIRAWYPAATRWLKLTHDQGYAGEHALTVATYRSAPRNLPRDLSAFSHFYWHSGSQLREYLQRFPGLTTAWHGCGPGNTWRIARELLDPTHLQRFANAAQFREELAA